MSEIDPRYIAAAKAAVYTQFPEMDGVEPTVSIQTLSGNPPRQLYVLTFRQQTPLAGAVCLQRNVRVTMNASGIIKITASK